jgi:hypothetical protein
MPARMTVTRLSGLLSLDVGPITVRVLSSVHGPYVLLGLPGGEVSLLATDQRALAQLGSTCLAAAKQLRSAGTEHDDRPAPPMSAVGSDHRSPTPDEPETTHEPETTDVPDGSDGRGRPARPGRIRPELLAEGASEWLSVSRTGQALGVTRQTLVRWHHTGQGPVRTMLGSRPLYRRVDLLDWINEAGSQIAACSRSGVA